MDHVDENNLVVGRVSKEDIYKKKLPHRIVHVFVLNPDDGKVYLQKRSEKVQFLPGYYCTSAGGHVRSGESYENAAKRELKEELGIEADVHFGTELKFISDEHIRFIQVFIAYATKGFSFADGEVENGGFFTLDEACRLIRDDAKVHPQLKICLEWLVARDKFKK
ncbi:MAG TPA: NUDIX domain-containing protein [Candidatus Nanoarchaeia archaeon]|nr:NUDIX domain-containing protein [Candidatus Nanoarchaeia archaeon]